jgi:hypothetical protein
MTESNPSTQDPFTDNQFFGSRCADTSRDSIDYESISSSTVDVSTATQDEVDKLVLNIFESCHDEFFEDGVESSFSKQLRDEIFLHENKSLMTISKLVHNNKVKPEIASEALSLLGRLDHIPTYNFRRWILERSLFSIQPIVRDGAGLGIASLDDPHSLPYLEKAIENEPLEGIRKDLLNVLCQLNETKQCLSY